MARSSKKDPYIDLHLLKKIDAVRASGGKRPIKIWLCRSIILSDLIGLTITVRNGCTHVSVSISDSMVGHKLGELSLTRTSKGHLADRKAEKK